MSARQPAAVLTVSGICEDLPIAPLPVGHNGYDVTLMNGHPQIVLPIGLTEDGQEVQLRVSDPQILANLFYLAMLAQGRYGTTVERTGRAA